MLRRVILACALSTGLAASASADAIGPPSGVPSFGFVYSASSSPFEAFEWTPLDLAAFSAYGGDFANVRRPVTPVYFFEDPFTPPEARGPEDEQLALQRLSMPFFEQLPELNGPRLTYEELPGLAGDDPDAPGTIPEPGALALIGVGLLTMSNRLRRAYQASGR